MTIGPPDKLMSRLGGNYTSSRLHCFMPALVRVTLTHSLQTIWVTLCINAVRMIIILKAR